MSKKGGTDGQGFPRPGRAAPRDFPRVKPKGNRKKADHLRFPTQSSPTKFPQSGNSFDHYYYARKSIKPPILNRMIIRLCQTGI